MKEWLIICHVAKPENEAQMCDAGLKCDIIFSFNLQFVINSGHIFALEDKTNGKNYVFHCI